MRIALLSAALLASFSIVACATSDQVTIADGGAPVPGTQTSETVPGASDAASFCASMCARVQSCDSTLDTQTCQNECTNGNAAVFPRLRTDVVELIVACFDGKDCKTVLGGGFVGACTADAIASVAPSAAASTFCEALSTAKTSCGGATTQTKAECLNGAKLYDDSAIAQAQNCVKRGCSEIDACVGAVFGSLGGSSTSKPPAGGSCSGKFSDLGACSTCAESSCCSEGSACYADADCRAIARACLTGGTASTQCSQAYTSATTSARTLASAFFSCGQSQCASSCPIGG